MGMEGKHKIGTGRAMDDPTTEEPSARRKRSAGNKKPTTEKTTNEREKRSLYPKFGPAPVEMVQSLTGRIFRSKRQTADTGSESIFDRIRLAFNKAIDIVKGVVQQARQYFSSGQPNAPSNMETMN